jgi:hypothetical protein
MVGIRSEPRVRQAVRNRLQTGCSNGLDDTEYQIATFRAVAGFEFELVTQLIEESGFLMHVIDFRTNGKETIFLASIHSS